MPITKAMKGLPTEHLAAEGIMYHDLCLTDCQRECTARLGVTIQLEQEAYLTNHPEIGAMIRRYLSNMTKVAKRKDILKDAGDFFTRPVEELDKEIRELLDAPDTGSYTREDKLPCKFEDIELVRDLKNIILSHFPPEPWVISSPELMTPNTPSSSFISIITSETTLPTPEPIPTPEPTMSEIFFNFVSTAVDKAVFSRVDDSVLRYDTAYVDLMKCVEQAMEVPVADIREDIVNLFFNAYKMFEIQVMEKERIAAEIAWEKRMRKKLKRTLRRHHNFRGYETPPTPKSEISSHESYKKPPPPPCICHPQYHYNRYPKDRFGIYLPLDTSYGEGNMTATPAISTENIVEDDNEDNLTDTKSVLSSRTVTSRKSTVGKKL